MQTTTTKPTNQSDADKPVKTSTPLEAQYIEFEKTINCTNGHSLAYAHLPHFNGNKSKPIHRWFTYKEGFSSELLAWVCKTIGIKLDDIESLLDPYAGVATSLLSAQMNYRGNHPLYLVGIERNPFVAFVARAKLGWATYDISRINKLIPKVVATIKRRAISKINLLDLSTIQDQRIFNRRKLQDLLYAHKVINKVLGNSPEREFFLLGWASIIETVSNVRKDGRALRIVEKEPRAPVYQLLENRWEDMVADIVKVNEKFEGTERGEVIVNIHNGDGRTLDAINQSDRRFDLILYSPPYLNNIDYSEVYKMELWLSGLISTQEDFKNLRLSTMRSHPSVKFPETNHINDLPVNSWPRRLLDALVADIEQDKNRSWRVRLMRAYMDDMLISLQNQYAMVKPGGHVVCVIGNSLHGKKEKATPVATDLLIAALAQAVGFKIKKVQVTRHLRRRDCTEHPLRESVIIMCRPKV
jgi:hypothetical protein